MTLSSFPSTSSSNHGMPAWTSAALTTAAWKQSNAPSYFGHLENCSREHPRQSLAPNAIQHAKLSHWFWPVLELTLGAQQEHVQAPLPHPYAPSGNINSLSIGRQVIPGQRKCFLFLAGCLQWAQSEVCIETSWCRDFSKHLPANSLDQC